MDPCESHLRDSLSCQSFAVLTSEMLGWRRLYIDGQMVVDNDGLHGVRRRAASVALTPGSHSLILTFFEWTGGEFVDALMTPPNSTTEVAISGAGFSFEVYLLGFRGPPVLPIPASTFDLCFPLYAVNRDRFFWPRGEDPAPRVLRWDVKTVVRGSWDFYQMRDCKGETLSLSGFVLCQSLMMWST